MSCTSTFCDKIFIPTVISKTLKGNGPKSIRNMFKKTYKRLCKNIYCNPGCKNTVFSSQPLHEIVNAVYKDTEHTLNADKGLTKSERDELKKTLKEPVRQSTLLLYKKIREKYKSPLKDSFYRALKNKTVKTLKRKGAVSGCIVKSHTF